VFDSHPLWDTQMQSDAMKLVLHFLQLDAARLPAPILTGFWRAAVDLAGRDDTVLNLVLEGTLTALRSRTDDDSTRETLEQIVAGALSAMQSHGLPSALLAWITLHKSGTIYAHLFTETPKAFMERIARSPIQHTHPNLLKQAEFIIASKYPAIG
jgi:hypothetical protein